MNERAPSPPPEKPREMEQELALIRAIEGLQDKYHIHGHAVSSEDDAVSIQQNGIYTAWSTLQDLTHQLPENHTRLLEKVRAWDYEARQYVILIAAPKNDDYAASDVADETRNAWENRERSKQYAATYVFEPADRPDSLPTPHKTDKRIPPKRIVGYWDDNKRVFHKNPLFVIETT